MTELRNDVARQPDEHRAALPTALTAQAAAGPVGLRRWPDDGPAPLSYSQESLWFLDRLGGGAAYNVPLAFRLRGVLDVAALRAALGDVVGRHDGLRTSMAEIDGRGSQRVVDEVAVELPVVAPAGADAAERLMAAHTLAEAVAAEPFDLTVAPLWRARLFTLADDDHLLVFVVHHIVFDAWSLGLFNHDLAAFYQARTGEPAAAEALPEIPVRYTDFARWQRDWLQGDHLEELAGYWRRQLSGVPVVEFPTDHPRPAQLTFAGRTLRFRLPASLTAAARALARAQRTSVYSVYLAAFLIVLNRYTGQEDLTIGSANASRGQAELDPLIGYFISMLALRVDVSGDPSVKELIRRVTVVVCDGLTHGELPFDRVVDAVRPPRDPARTPIFSIGFGMHSLGRTPELPDIRIETYLLELGIARFDMTWNLSELADGLEILLEYNTALFEKSTMDALAGQFAQTVRAVTADPHQPISRVQVLTDAEIEELLTRWNGEPRPAPTATLTESFESLARTGPDRVAVVAGGVATTYGELNARANRLARLLAARGAGPGTRVALTVPRDLDMITAIMATLKTGASYTPIDPAHPANRIESMLADATPVVWLTHGRLAGALPVGGPPKLLLDELADALAGDAAGPDGTDLATGPALDDEAYLLFTSGTTGVPKGVPIQHGMVAGYVRTHVDRCGLTPDDRILCYASLNFDVSVLEIFTGLLIGARLCVVSDTERIDMPALQRLIEVEEVTFIDIPPPVMALLTPERFVAATHIVVGGEIFNGELVNRWNKGRKLINAYGPTECTIAMIFHDCAGHWDSSPPIGLPAANHVAHVVDRHLQPLPYGAAGELVIGGEGLTTGYLNDPELTARKIVPDPFGTAPGGRLYHTGDLVRRLGDGTLLCLGRVDDQVKIRGQRIELGEVESVLATHPSVRQVAVLPWTDEAGDKHLVAYISSTGSTTVETTTLRQHVGRHLPRYMVPAYVVALPELPLTVNGKVDARSLPAPDETARIGSGPIAPTTETERVLAVEIVAKLLGLSRVGIHDNFFELGGNSLQATQLTSRIRDRFQVEIALADFFQSPTVAQLATLVDQSSTAAGPTDDELLALLAAMPEDEAARLMDRHMGPEELGADG